MNVFTILSALLTLALSGVLVFLTVALLALLTTARVKRSWKLAIWSSIGVAGTMVALAGLYFGVHRFLFGPYDPKSTEALGEAYRADFGTLPPAGVTVLKARQIIIGDMGAQWLLLRATQEEIERHKAMGFTRSDAIPRAFDGKTGANTPKWWRPPIEQLEIYENKKWSKAGGWWWSEAAIGVDRTNRLIWFIAFKS